MTEILLERLSIKGRNWVRTHATDTEEFALCSKAIHEEIEAVELGEGEVTCPERIEIKKNAKEYLTRINSQNMTTNSSGSDKL